MTDQPTQPADMPPGSTPNGNGPAMDPREEMARLLQPRPQPVGWTTSPEVFTSPEGEVRVLGQIAFMHGAGSFVGFWAAKDLGRLIKDLQGLKQACEKLETERFAQRRSPTSLHLPAQPGLILPPGHSPTTGG